MKYSFQFKLFGKKVQMFHEAQMGIVIEKETDVICVYGTDDTHQTILCAIPLCPPKYLKGAEYIIEFHDSNRATVSVEDLKIVIDFQNQKCANNKALRCYGSDSWGNNVQISWNELQ